MVVNPVIDTVQMFFDGEYKNPGTITVSKGSEVQFDVSVAGEDGAWYESTNCLVWLLDKLRNKAVWQSNQFTLTPNQVWHGGGGFTVERDMDLVFQTWYWNGSTWVFSDQSDVWKVRLKSSGSGSQPSQPSGHPVPEINRQETFFLLPPDYDKYCYPGTYTVKKGSKVLFELSVQNKSNNKGTCYAWLVNEKDKEVWGKMFNFKYAGEGVALTGSYVVNEDTTLKFQTWWWDGKGWKFCDEYGSWTFKIEHAQPSNPPYPVIDRQKTYILLNGKRLPDPPCDVKVSGKAELEAVLTVVNKGGSGKCKFAAYDTLRGLKLGEYEKTIPAGATVEIRGRMTVTRDIGFKWLVYRWNNGEWEFVDDMG